MMMQSIIATYGIGLPPHPPPRPNPKKGTASPALNGFLTFNNKLLYVENSENWCSPKARFTVVQD